MGGAMSRRKGKTFERAVAKQMTDWLGFKVSPTPSSGAYGTREGWSSLSGDLMFAQDFQFYCELKCRETFSIEAVVSDGADFWDWWNVTEFESKAHGKRPLLICKRNHHAAWFFVDTNDTPMRSQIPDDSPYVVSNDVIGFPLIYLFGVNPRLL